LLVVGGATAGVYFGVVKNRGGSAATAHDAGADPWSGPEAGLEALADASTPRTDQHDPWAGNPAASDPWTDSNPDPDDGDDDDPEPARQKGLTGECAEYARALDRLAKCSSLPEVSRKGIVQAAVTLRKSYTSMPPDMRRQFNATCTQGLAGIQQALATSGCSP
jgi:hypothetical protein